MSKVSVACAVLLLAACGPSAGGNTASDGAIVPGDGSGAHLDARFADAAPIGAHFRFGIVGDTRPPNINGTASYPTATITKIWADLEAESPHPDFAVSTGDYMFASTTSTQQKPQLDKYLGARAQFSTPEYAALGNHECTGATTSNCGTGNRDGHTSNYDEFMSRMVMPLGFTEPYYAINFQDPSGAWTAKLVLVAANAWTTAQATWLEQTLAQPTTYTFIVRHESNSASTAPGVTPSKHIIDAHPYTILIVGHAHTYQHVASDREVICGTGGAPLTSGANYGYAIVERLDSGDIQFTQRDYQSLAVADRWRVHADGSPAP